MAVSYVNLAADVYFVCVNQVLSTDGGEILGLLVGQVHMERRFADIAGIITLKPSDKRKVGGKISPEVLSSASREAERISGILKRPVHIIGWYHCHPKLTVSSSQIDVNTEDRYQLMDDISAGITLSVFKEDPTKQGAKIRLTCYQSQNVKKGTAVETKRADIPVHIVSSNYLSSECITTLIKLPSFLHEEENHAYNAACEMGGDFLTKHHNSSVYIKSLGQLAEVISVPLVKMMEERILNNEMKKLQLKFIRREKLALVEQFKKEISFLKAEIEGPSSNTTSENSQYIIPDIKFEDIILPTKHQPPTLKECAQFIHSSAKKLSVVKPLKSSGPSLAKFNRSGQDRNRPGHSQILRKEEKHALEFSSYLNTMKRESDSGLGDKEKKWNIGFDDKGGKCNFGLDDDENKPDIGLGKGTKSDFNFDFNFDSDSD